MKALGRGRPAEGVTHLPFHEDQSSLPNFLAPPPWCLWHPHRANPLFPGTSVPTQWLPAHDWHTHPQSCFFHRGRKKQGQAGHQLPAEGGRFSPESGERRMMEPSLACQGSNVPRSQASNTQDTEDWHCPMMTENLGIGHFIINCTLYMLRALPSHFKDWNIGTEKLLGGGLNHTF